MPGIPNPFNIALDSLLTAKAEVIGALGVAEIGQIVSELHGGGPANLGALPEWMLREVEKQIGSAEGLIGRPLFEALINAPTGVNLSSAGGREEAIAVQFVSRMLGFAVALPLATAELKSVLEGVLGQNAAGKAVLEALDHIPEDIGINWALGSVMANIFETATSTPIEEAIARQVRPARFGFREIRALLKQHHLSEPEAREFLTNIGYRDADIERLLRLNDVFLTVGDLQQLFLLGLISEPEVKDQLMQQGYSEADADRLVSLYLEKSETAGGDLLRTVARNGYLQGKITEGQLRSTLKSINVPDRSVELEVAALNMQLSWQQHDLSVSQVKSLYDGLEIDDRQATTRLVALHYSEQDAQALVASWSKAKKAGHSGMTVQRILAYLLGGVFDKGKAMQELQTLGVRGDEATLLIEHPGAYGGVYAHPLTPATVAAAVKAGDLEVERARELLAGLNMAPEEIDLTLAVAISGQVKGKKPKGAAKSLSEGQVIEAMRYGLASDSWTVNELVAIGYSDANAQLLVAIERTKLAGGQVPDSWTVLS